MFLYDVLIATTLFIISIGIVYNQIGWKRIAHCYAMWFQKSYWTTYNIVEAISWATKAIIIVPGLVFGVQIWWLYFITLFTSLALIWASNEKLLPTLVGFNSIWVWLSCMVLVKAIAS